jgi:hypothetical protein
VDQSRCVVVANRHKAIVGESRKGGLSAPESSWCEKSEIVELRHTLPRSSLSLSVPSGDTLWAGNGRLS